jgi:hypothetical protein
MKHKIITIVAVLALLVIAYLAGQSNGSHTAVEQQTERDLDLHKELVELDQSFLTNISTRPNTMSSGAYTLETRFAGSTTKESSLELEFSNGQLLKVTGLPIQDIVQTGNVVSWEQFDYDEGPSARYVGLIDGDVIWGRVYVKPGQGWREGEPPSYGVWRLYPKSDK